MPKGETIQMQPSGRPEHSSPAIDQAKAQTKHLKRMADTASQPWYKTSVGWFSLIAAIASVIAAVAALTSP